MNILCEMPVHTLSIFALPSLSLKFSSVCSVIFTTCAIFVLPFSLIISPNFFVALAFWLSFSVVGIFHNSTFVVLISSYAYTCKYVYNPLTRAPTHTEKEDHSDSEANRREGSESESEAEEVKASVPAPKIMIKSEVPYRSDELESVMMQLDEEHRAHTHQASADHAWRKKKIVRKRVPSEAVASTPIPRWMTKPAE